MEFLQNYKKYELKVTTYDSYMLRYRKHILNTQLGMTKLENVRAANLQQYYNEKLKEGYSSKYVRLIEVIFNSALDRAFKLRMIPENPNIFTALPPKEKYEAKVLTREEVERIVVEAKEEELYPIVVTTIYTGMRKGEVMALNWENVNFKEQKIYVKNSLCRVYDEQPGKDGRYRVSYQILEPKTKKSIRMIPMLDEVYTALKEQKRRQEVLKAAQGNQYLDQGLVFTDVRFHDLRHTFATLLIESDVSMKLVQELLGHSTITTSMDIYTHVSDQMKEKAIGQISHRDGNVV